MTGAMVGTALCRQLGEARAWSAPIAVADGRKRPLGPPYSLRPASMVMVVRRHVAMVMVVIVGLRMVQRLGFAIAHHHGLDHLA